MKIDQAASGTIILLLASLLAFVGCSTTSTVLVGKVRPPISPDRVVVYNTEPVQYEEIAIIEANSKRAMAFGEQAKIDAAVERLKREAAKLGANGVLINTMSDQVGGGISFGVGTGSYSRGSSASVGVGTSTATSYKIISATAIHVGLDVEEGSADSPR